LQRLNGAGAFATPGVASHRKGGLLVLNGADPHGAGDELASAADRCEQDASTEPAPDGAGSVEHQPDNDHRRQQAATELAPRGARWQTGVR
jgi:hypothetical protein